MKAMVTFDGVAEYVTGTPYVHCPFASAARVPQHPRRRSLPALCLRPPRRAALHARRGCRRRTRRHRVTCHVRPVGRDHRARRAGQLRRGGRASRRRLPLAARPDPRPRASRAHLGQAHAPGTRSRPGGLHACRAHALRQSGGDRIVRLDRHRGVALRRCNARRLPACAPAILRRGRLSSGIPQAHARGSGVAAAAAPRDPAGEGSVSGAARHCLRKEERHRRRVRRAVHDAPPATWGRMAPSPSSARTI